MLQTRGLLLMQLATSWWNSREGLLDQVSKLACWSCGSVCKPGISTMGQNGVENRLDNLAWSMVELSGKSAKFRCKAAHLRALIPWVHQTAEEVLGRATVHDSTLRRAYKASAYLLSAAGCF